MSSLDLKVGQVGKVIGFRTGLDLTAATSITVRVRRGDGTTLNSYLADKDALDPTRANLTIKNGMFDVAEICTVDLSVNFPGGKVLKTDQNLTFDVGDI